MGIEDFFSTSFIFKAFAVLSSIVYLIYTLFFLQQVNAIMKVLRDSHNGVFLVLTYIQILLALLLLLLSLVII